MGARSRPAATVAFLAGLLIPCPTPAAGQGRETTTTLDKTGPLERSIHGAAQHRFELTLQAGEYASITVAQRGIDVVVQVVDPDGKTLASFNDDIRVEGIEQVEMVAAAAGTHVLVVRPAWPRAASGSYVIRVTGTRAATERDRTLQQVRTLRAEYVPMINDRRDGTAQPIAERALALIERVAAPDDLMVGTVIKDLATIHQHAIDRAGAASLFERAAAIYEKSLGPDDPATAGTWNSLSAQYGALGQRAKAEKLVRRALDVSEKTLGPNHPQVASCLMNLGNRRADAGDDDEAIALYRRALTIIEQAYGPDAFENAAVLNDLGIMLLDEGKAAEAEGLFLRAQAIEERVLGPGALDLAIGLQNLGVAARQRNDVAKAEEYYLRALAIRRKNLHPDHPDIAANLNNLAIIYRIKGDVALSLATHAQALEIRERSTGPYSDATLQSLGNLARTYAAIGDVPNAILFQRRVDSVIETQLSLNLGTGSERQKLAFVNGVADRTDRTISLDVSTRFSQPAATSLAALVVLQRKGRVLDAMVDTRAGLRERLGNPQDQDLLDRLSATTARLARVALIDPPASGEDRVRTIKDLEATKESLEAALSERSADFRAQSQPVTLSAVQAALPHASALIEFAVYHPFNPKADRNSDAYGEPRYVAYVLTPDAPPHGVDLGPAATIDALIDALRQALRDPMRDDVDARARAVDATVMVPVRAAIGDATHLLISPDGRLNLVPFETFRDEKNRYAIERYTISYLTTGRDLLRLHAPRTRLSEPVVVADPTFGEPAAASDSTARGSHASRRSITSVDDLSNAYFARLAGTAEEARQIKALFPEATLLTGTAATKTALGQIEAPRILHVATHGFFLQDPKHRISNPLLRSGLALSGANLDLAGTRGQDGEAGIMTALEASQLNLWGTKLVTLSACDTGVGEVRNGEGVYGLRRAFFLAGAETLVMSLWPVSDYVARQLMVAYYNGLKRGLGRGEALRQAALAMHAKQNRRHPFYWASFIQAGDWTPLDGRQ